MKPRPVKRACSYAIARILPSAEKREFVNVGVALICPETGFFDFQLAREKERVTEPSRELDDAVYKAGMKFFSGELTALREALLKHHAGGGFEMDYALGAFRELLLRTRESNFWFSAPRTELASDPAQYLRTLHAFYVERPFMPQQTAA